MKARQTAFILFTAFSCLSCSVNILENFAEKTSNDAIKNEALDLINAGDFDSAIAKIAEMTDEYENTREIVKLKATAYGGKCGVQFLPFATALGTLGPTNFLFPLLMNHFRGGSAGSLAACVQAETLIRSIGAVSARTVDENIDLFLYSLGKIGAVLSAYADTAPADGTVDAGYNFCNTSIPDADMRELGTGITLAIETLGAIGSAIDLGDDSLTDIQDACADLAAAPIPPPGAYDFCDTTTPAGFSAQELLAIRSLLVEGSVVGFNMGACAGGDVGTASCRCF